MSLEIQEQKLRKTLPYYGNLVKIRSFLEENLENFPYEQCSRAARFVSIITGLKEEAGGFYGGIVARGHAWNFDPKRKLYIDLTQDQFGGDIPKICIQDPGELGCYLFTTPSMRWAQANIGNSVKGFNETIQNLVDKFSLI